MNIDLQPAHLEDELVKLVPLTETDFSILFEVASDPLIWEQHPEQDRWKRAVFEKFFRTAIDSRGAFLIIDSRNGEVAGSSRFYEFDPENGSVKIGYTFIARKFWGGSFNRSLKKLMIDHAFRFVDVVYFDIGVRNIRSRKAVEKLGATEVDHPDPEKCTYALKKEIWGV
jgi:RimJ/RimL family protein N-acetyltransferase